MHNHNKHRLQCTNNSKYTFHAKKKKKKRIASTNNSYE